MNYQDLLKDFAKVNNAAAKYPNDKNKNKLFEFVKTNMNQMTEETPALISYIIEHIDLDENPCNNEHAEVIVEYLNKIPAVEEIIGDFRTLTRIYYFEYKLKKDRGDQDV